MNATNVLLLAILLVLLLKFFPGETTFLAGVGLVGPPPHGCIWFVTQFPTWRRRRKADKHQAEQDERDFWEWSSKHDAIRAKFDPQDQWNEATQLPHEYRDEVRQLNLQYRAMLQRRNGWSTNDFVDSDA
jgi:hypothetical protein